ncbi:SIS domain-containing protein [Paenarthrobacter sp. PH39-S1]|uniref:D-sedoheptulose-7-phosphate isomerase n=1 Tax=Paenarthrobacter sp. PH39-S1 TaxID=3046204 RepID=UPI0024BB7ED0|nr:SIS domain-containing protein [Paenarthrobacter sp. PH39-S1]MDJ0355353.1 SIS domain-containing protein [Paenarthrobacter sp. PH39-S1]
MTTEPITAPTEPNSAQPAPPSDPAPRLLHDSDTAAAPGAAGPALLSVLQHLDNVAPALESLRREANHLSRWGTDLARRLMSGQRLLTAGNGGSAAEAQHLTAELVGRFDGEREPFSAIALHAETSALTAIGNDYGYEEIFARQVRAHGRVGDVLLLISTSGRSPNLLKAVEAARAAGVSTWALTGRGPNPLTRSCDDFIAVNALPANAQEGHLIALHALCRAFDSEVTRARAQRPVRAAAGLPGRNK